MGIFSKRNSIHLLGDAGANWRPWAIPAAASILTFTLIGGGGGGSNSGGGASGGVSSLTISASVIPRVIYLSLGSPGIGATGASATAGGVSYISVAPSTTAANLILQANGGGPGSTNTGGTGGAAVTIGSLGFAYYGAFTAVAGQTGANQNGAITWGASGLIVSGGAGGGSAAQPGANITGTGPMPTVTGSAASVNGINGSGGYFFTQPYLFSGGSGGGAASGAGSNSNQGGVGGPGCGGGGGGVVGSGTAGNGGNGGPGIVIISWV